MADAAQPRASACPHLLAGVAPCHVGRSRHWPEGDL